MSKNSAKTAVFAVGLVGLLGLASYGDIHAETSDSPTAMNSPVVSPEISKDPLFSRMEGHWTGTGTVSMVLSGRQLALQIDVNSVVSIVDGKERLTSTSQITETQPGAAPRTYETSYWITPDAVSGTYDLGYGTAAQVSSTGTLDAHLTFETGQTLGAYVIHSSTQFQADGSSIYTEFATQGQSVVSRTVIHYQH